MKKKIDSKTIKYLTSFLAGVLIMTVVLVMMNYVMAKSLSEAREDYYASCTQVTNGYSQAIYWYLENYHTSLSSVYDEELFSSGNKEQIQNWLIENQEFMQEDFCLTFFVDTDGIAYYSNGQVVDLHDRPYLNFPSAEHTPERGSFYVTDVIHSRFSDDPIFIIEEPVYSEDLTYHGILCASIKIARLEKISQEIKIGETRSISIQDRNGVFLFHTDRSYIGTTYTPENPKYANVTSQMISKAPEGFIETQNKKGEIVNLFYSRVKDSGWTVGLVFPSNQLQKIDRQEKHTRLLVILISLVSLIILISFENIVLEIFYKRHLINTDYDPLTNLWTRQRLENEATKMMRKNPKAKFMLIESDIRGFKFINQNYGENAADKMIVFYATQLSELSNQNHGIIGRGFADHFYTFVKINGVRSAMKSFREGVEKLNKEIKNYELPFFPKFGISFLLHGQQEDTTIQSLIGQASFAKSTIKDNMITQYAIYNSKLLSQVNREHYLESAMEEALVNKEFFVMYQPKIALSSDRIVGAEALVRWYNKEEGLLTPDSFIPLFERNGFITKLDFYVYEQVFQFLSRQIKEKKPVVPISMNMSRNHSKPDKFMHDFMALFRKYDIPPYLIQLEILERSVMDSNTLQEITNMLHKEGFSVAMDDFGSGESSLNMLSKVPVDVLKFDRDFLLSSTKENGTLDAKSAKFIEILIELSKHLEKETVFEGVETQSQRDFLRSIQCDQAQGYFYSKPLSEQDLVEFIRLHS